MRYIALKLLTDLDQQADISQQIIHFTLGSLDQNPFR